MLPHARLLAMHEITEQTRPHRCSGLQRVATRRGGLSLRLRLRLPFRSAKGKCPAFFAGKRVDAMDATGLPQPCGAIPHMPSAILLTYLTQGTERNLIDLQNNVQRFLGLKRILTLNIKL